MEVGTQSTYVCLWCCYRHVLEQPQVHVSFLCTCLCVPSVHAFVFCACTEWVFVCMCVSHNSTTIGQRVQPSCSLSGHSARWFTDLIHFAPTLTHCLSLQFRVNVNNIWLHFCCTCCFVNVLQHKLNSSLRLLFWLAALLQPQWPQQIACRHAVLGSMAGLVRHVGQLVYGYCSMSLFMLLFLRPNNVWSWMCCTKYLSHLTLASWEIINYLGYKSTVVKEIHHLCFVCQRFILCIKYQIVRWGELAYSSVKSCIMPWRAEDLDKALVIVFPFSSDRRHRGVPVLWLIM